MAGYANTANHGQLNIRGINLMGPAVRVWELAALDGHNTRGDDITIPYGQGALLRPRRLDRLDIGLYLNVIGEVDLAGTVNTNEWSGLSANMAALSPLGDPTAAADPYAGDPIIWTPPDPARGPQTANGWVEDWTVSTVQQAPINRVSFTLVIPAGGWA